MADLEIRAATVGDADVIGGMVSRLLCELYPDFADEYQPAATIATARRMLIDESYAAFVASSGATFGGVIGLSECKAIYAHGAFGEIAELFVEPRFRSTGLGARLVEAAIELGHRRGWSSIEVGAPDVPRWQRTVEFYLRQGFATVGPRLYRRIGRTEA